MGQLSILYDSGHDRAVLYDFTTEKPLNLGFYSIAEAECFVRFCALVPVTATGLAAVIPPGDPRSLRPNDLERVYDTFLRATRCDRCGTEEDYEAVVDLSDERFVASVKDPMSCACLKALR